MFYNKYISKVIIFFLIFILNFTSGYVYADDVDSSNDYVSEDLLDSFSSEASNVFENSLNLNSRSCVVIDRKSKYILYGKNENNKVKMASTTKIMTAIIVIENGNLDKTVEISKKSANTGGSRLGLKSGDKITINHLLYGLMLCSGNDAAVALAEAVAGSVSDFAVLMNKKAIDLGLNTTHFETPHGLDSENHYTTAYELALLTDYALQNETFLKIVGTKYYTVNINGYPKNLTNTNELLGNLNGVYGVKTGFTNGANRCLVTSCKRNDMDIICVVLGADTKNFRTQDSIKLIEYAFKTYTYVNIENIINEFFDEWINNHQNAFFIEKGVEQNINLKLSSISTPIIPIKNTDINNIEIIPDINTYFIAPVIENSKVGNLNILLNNEVILHCDVLCENYIAKKNIGNYLLDFFKDYLSIFSSI